MTALVALAVALLALVVAAVALARSGGTTVVAGPTASPTASQPPASTDSLPPPSTSSEPGVPTPSGPLPTGIEPDAQYTVAYQQQKLRVQPACNRYVDLDEPRVGGAGGEFYYCGTNPALNFTSPDIAIAAVGSPTAAARDCAEAIRTAPLNEPLAPSRGQNLCVLTSRSKADAEGIPWRIVLMTVDAIADDGTLSTTVTAWDIPR